MGNFPQTAANVSTKGEKLTLPYTWVCIRFPHFLFSKKSSLFILPLQVNLDSLSYHFLIYSTVSSKHSNSGDSVPPLIPFSLFFLIISYQKGDTLHRRFLCHCTFWTGVADVPVNIFVSN